MSVIKSKVQSDIRADKYGAYEYPPAMQEGKKVLPGHKRFTITPVLLVLFLAACVCIYFYSNLSSFGFKSGPTPSLAVATNGGMPPVFHSPSLTAAQIDKILCAAHSPACGSGKDLYTGSLKSGVDDLFVMGVFYAESQYGTLGAALSNHSVGNLSKDGVLIHYASWQAGYADFYSKAQASNENNPQSVLDYVYIGGLINPLDLKKERAVEPDLHLVLSTIKKLEA